MTNPLSTVAPWDLVADGYTEKVMPVFEKWAEDSFERVGLESTHRVLDAACGPGTVALLLASRVRSVTAFDFSPAMIVWEERAAVAVEWLTQHLAPSVKKLHSTAYLGIGQKPLRDAG